jgi:hypothetical protein
MSNSTVARRSLAVAAWLVAFHVLLAYGLPEGLFIGLVILIGVIYWRAGVLAAVTMSVTLVLITAAYWAALRITGFEERIYYRPDEKYLSFDYQNNHRRYAPNVHIEMDMPHGDLRAMTTENIAEPRHVVFETDRDGFRDSRDYHGQHWLLVGDSFVTGHGNSQENLLVTQLQRDYGIDAYSLGNTGDLADYAAYIRGFRKRYHDDVRALLFVFEGNDFEVTRRRPEWALARYGRRYYSLFSELNTYRVTQSLLKRLLRGGQIHAGSAIEIHAIGGRPMAFYKPYVDVTRRAQLPELAGFEQELAGMQPYVERVYFVPTKYRVYHAQFAPGETLPDVQWDYLSHLCQKYGLRCTNLTAPLVSEAAAQLGKGEVIWWRDDTHWNPRGIAVAARVVAGDLRAAAPRH